MGLLQGRVTESAGEKLKSECLEVPKENFMVQVIIVPYRYFIPYVVHALLVSLG